MLFFIVREVWRGGVVEMSDVIAYSAAETGSWGLSVGVVNIRSVPHPYRDGT